MLSLLQSNPRYEDIKHIDNLDGITIENGLQEDDTQLDLEDHLKKSPIIPKEVYGVIPKILKDGAAIFSTAREKDVFLTSSLSILSGCFPNVWGMYDQKKVHPNIYSMIIAPPASGKSAMISAKELAMSIHESLRSQMFDGSGAEVNPGFLGHYLFIPGNISAAGMLAFLRDNQGTGIICESETDTLTNAIKQDWGNFSEMLRKAFQHESISCGRRNEIIEINKPKLSVALTGTLNQVQPLIRSIYDGLFSRFIFYIYKDTPKWRDPSTKKNFIYDSYMNGIQDRIKAMYDFMKGTEYSYDLTVIQWLKLNKTYEERLRKTVAFKGEYTSATIFRLGLIHFRITMILSILRFFENGPQGNFITCSDLDYSIAELLCELYLRHGLLVYSILTDGKDKEHASMVEKFFNSLPITPFRRKEAVIFGKTQGIAERTVDKYLRILKDTGFFKNTTNQGEYLKVVD